MDTLQNLLTATVILVISIVARLLYLIYKQENEDYNQNSEH